MALTFVIGDGGSAKLLGEVTDPARQRPPERALRWAAELPGAGCRVTSVRRLTEGGWHANHALTVVDRGGRSHRLVLRRWARPEWRTEDPDFTAERAARVLGLLCDTPVPAPWWWPPIRRPRSATSRRCF